MVTKIIYDFHIIGIMSKKAYSVVVLVCGLAFTAFAGNVFADSSAGNQQHSPESLVPPDENAAFAYTPRSPIRINSDGDPQWTAFPGRTISGFTINGVGAGYCIYIGNCTVPFTIKGNYLHDASGNPAGLLENTGIYLYKTQNAKVENNICYGNLYYGIYMNQSSGNTLIKNTCNANPEGGIHLNIAVDNNITSNSLNGNYKCGIVMRDSENNTITGNLIISSYMYGAVVENSQYNLFNHNNISINGYGIYIQNVQRGRFTNNTLTTNVRYDYYIKTSTGNIFDNNTLKKCYGEGFYLETSPRNHFTYNNITNCGGFAVNITDFTSSYNRLHHNNFIDNNKGKIQAFDSSINFWNSSAEGNHWSDWTAPDTDGNGIVDTPYIISAGSADFYPLTLPFGGAGAKVPEFITSINILHAVAAAVAVLIANAITTTLRKKRM